jgi:hypothetical protein
MMEAELIVAEMVRMEIGCLTPLEVLGEVPLGKHVVFRWHMTYCNRKWMESNRSTIDLKLAT